MFQFSDGNSVSVSDVNVVNFLPVLMDEYFHYHGSLTTGGCEESVNWVVFKNPIAIRVDKFSKKESVKKYTFCRSPICWLFSR